MTFLLAALLAAQPAPTAPTAPVVTPPAKPTKEKTICKSSEDSASRLGRRVCKKESAWANGKLDHQESSRAGSSLRPQN